MQETTHSLPVWKSPWAKGGLVLGFALGGFFDGILLHQILQWHHLLSLVAGISDIRLQVLWDGYFHALMYVIAVAGLLGLWRAHRKAGAVRGRLLFGAVIAGFGLWHVADGVLSHWLLGIHRVKLDSDTPLVWDLIWFAAFGLVPLLAGWLLARRDGAGPAFTGSTLVLLALSAATAGAGFWSLKPPSDQPFTTVVFRPGLAPERVIAALAAADARLVWSDPSMGVVTVDAPPGRRLGFYKHGALLVSGSGVPAGCLNWSRI